MGGLWWIFLWMLVVILGEFDLGYSKCERELC